MSDGPGTTSGDAPDTRVALALHVIAVLGIDAGILWLICFRIYNKGAYDYGPWYADEYAKWGLTAPLLILAFCLLLTILARILQHRSRAKIARKQAAWEAAAQRHCLQTFKETPSTFAMIKHIIADSLAVWVTAAAIEAVILLTMLVFHDFFITSGGSFYIRETILGVVILAVIPLVLFLSLSSSLGQRPEHIVHRAQLDMAITRRVTARSDLQGSLSMQTSGVQTGALTESIGQGTLEQYEEVTLGFATEEGASDRHSTQKEGAKTSEEVLAPSSTSKTSSN